MELAEFVCKLFDEVSLKFHPISKQIIRCLISVPSNIAEGAERQYKKENIQFVFISRATLYELETQIELSRRLKFINNTSFNLINNKIDSCKKLINGFIKYLKDSNLK